MQSIPQSVKDFLKVYWPFIAIAVLGVILALRFVEPAPPRKVTLAAGAPGGAYAAYAERYVNLLAEHKVDVEIINTEGSLDNLRLLTVGDADIALLQGGLTRPEDAERLRTLGRLFYEPFWVFVREDYGASRFEDLRDARVAIGAEGSGTRALAQHVRREFGGEWGTNSNLPLGGQAAANALLAGDIDAAAFSAGYTAPYVSNLMSADGIALLSFPRAPALAQRQPAFAHLTLLRGVMGVGENIPSADVEMIAPVAQLVVREDLHPAIHAILLEAASDIHSAPSLLASPGQFPDGTRTDLPLSKEAQRFYRDGPSALRRYFSFGMANFLERAWILLIPMVTLLIPLARVAPPIYRWRVRRKIYVWYEDLRELESKGRAAATDDDREAVRDELTALQEEIGKLEVPLSYTDDVYRLRNHVAFVNQLLGNLDSKDALAPVATA
ncbi:MAG: TAXI family TRAP transporter solute-binding subunit [Pseudomonadota bacterium]